MRDKREWCLPSEASKLQEWKIVTHEKGLVRLKERIKEQKHQMRDTDFEIEEAHVPKVPSKMYTLSASARTGQTIKLDLETNIKAKVNP